MMRLKLSDIIEHAENAVITLWHACEADRLNSGQDLFEISTDKATFDVPSPCDGTLSRIFKKEGDKVSSEEDIAEIVIA